MTKGRFTISTRIYLTEEQRDKLITLVREHDVHVPDLLTELLVSFLDHLPESELAAFLQAETVPDDDIHAELQQRRNEVRRLRARATTGGADMPAWLQTYIVDLENEIQRLEESMS